MWIYMLKSNSTLYQTPDESIAEDAADCAIAEIDSYLAEN